MTPPQGRVRRHTGRSGTHPSQGGALALAEIMATLTPRDSRLLDLLGEHLVLSTEQVWALGFPSRDRTEQRLRLLARRQVLDRFRGYTRPGSQSWRWTLGPLGAALLAARHGAPQLPRPSAVRDRTARLAANPRLNHLLGVNQFFVDLAVHARTHPDSRLLQWAAERRATTAAGELARPDAAGTWQEHHHVVQFWLEYDTGTEHHRQLAAKLEGYRRLTRSGGATWPVLFWLPTVEREHRFHRTVGAATTPPLIATATTEHATALGDDPAGRLWLPVGGHTRHRLADLTHTHTHTTVGTPPSPPAGDLPAWVDLEAPSDTPT